MFLRATVIAIIVTGFIVYYFPLVGVVKDIRNKDSVIVYETGELSKSLSEDIELNDYGKVFLPWLKEEGVGIYLDKSVVLDLDIDRRDKVAKGLGDKSFVAGSRDEEMSLFDVTFLSLKKSLRSYMKGGYDVMHEEPKVTMSISNMSGGGKVETHMIRLEGVSMDDLWMPVNVMVIVGVGGIIYMPMLESSSGIDTVDKAILDYSNRSNELKKLDRGYYRVNFRL